MCVSQGSFIVFSYILFIHSKPVVSNFCMVRIFKKLNEKLRELQRLYEISNINACYYHITFYHNSHIETDYLINQNPSLGPLKITYIFTGQSWLRLLKYTP